MKKKIRVTNLIYNPLTALITITILFDILFIDLSFDLVFLLIMSLWIIVLRYLKKGSRESYIASLILMFCLPILQLFGQEVYVIKTAAWAFLALSVGVIINVYEYFNIYKKVEK